MRGEGSQHGETFVIKTLLREEQRSGERERGKGGIGGREEVSPVEYRVQSRVLGNEAAGFCRDSPLLSAGG